MEENELSPISSNMSSFSSIVVYYKKIRKKNKKKSMCIRLSTYIFVVLFSSINSTRKEKVKKNASAIQMEEKDSY